MWIVVLTWVKTNWKWVVGGIAVLLAWWGLQTVLSWHQASVDLPKAREEVKQEEKRRIREEEEMRKDYAKLVKASKGYQDELQDIRNARVPDNTVIRVCRPSAPHLPPTGTTAGGPGGASSTAPVVQPTVEFDTRPLFELAAKCDGLAAQVRGLQAAW